ncbi:MAG: hypothetical protein Q7S57_00505 [bacterium]|nr:hypothetical protein [bacterium]
MDIKQQFTTVTRFSKFVALTMLVLLPFVGFYIGVKFKASVTNTSAPIIVSPTITPKVSSLPIASPKEQKPVECTQEAKVCPDGSAVGRTGPNCEFSVCPSSKDILKDDFIEWAVYSFGNEYSINIKADGSFLFVDEIPGGGRNLIQDAKEV